MRADNSSHLIEAARRKHEECLRRVTAAIREADRLDRSVTIQGVAKAAGVSPSWIYTQPEIYEAIRARRTPGDRQALGRVPKVEIAGHASQQKRIELLASRLKETNQDNHRLRSELAVVHAELRRLRQLQPRSTVSREQEGNLE